ncbi:type II toxin-antitoxin system ParD family antitoxin [Aurantiacibacter luteus]|uniref:Addiction module antitoxin n=1 Tax=Aurantiacibacter luteus TaxID=1581420 RepID=A0A0G9MUW7_9SPHN|nr:type II toxin-antitoxin system ParD family antitoxin [Aurantiacibacter luteus]KLE34505.1 addiction module antitoxin [Aurantiacibacter luteus]
MPVVRKTITLSDTQDAFIKAQIRRGAFINDSEYIRDLVRRDQEAQDKLANLRDAIAEGLTGGISERTLDEIWGDAERRAADA